MRLFPLAVALALAGPVLAAEPARTLVVAPEAPGAATAQRVALVIGNGAYREAPLPNPANDARAMAEALRGAGFTVLLHTDLDQRGLLAAVRDFGQRLRGGGVGLFYFAGHGMQIKGRNYLIPVGADIQREDEVAYAALDAQAVLDKMESAGNGTNLMILDACRNNPFARSFRSSVQGLAPMEAPVGTLVAFATAPGAVASDGAGGNGLYTQHLLAAMRRPGAKVEDVFKQVRAAVRRESQGRQIPWEVTSLEGDLYLVAPPPAPDPAAALEDSLWALVQASREPLELRAFLARFPQGRHAAAARQRLAALAPAPVAAPAPAPVPVAAAATLPAAGRNDDGHDRRTAELLAELGRPAVAAAPAPGGDKWSMRVIDRWKGEVLRHYTLGIAKVDALGDRITGAGSVYDPLMRPRRIVNRETGETTEYSSPPMRWWADMRPGQEREQEFRATVTRTDGTLVREVATQARARVAAREAVEVPAGRFEAFRVEIRGSNRILRPGQPEGFETWTTTWWYVPELRYYAAFEVELRDRNGAILRREREELTSMVLKDVQHASR